MQRYWLIKLELPSGAPMYISESLGRAELVLCSNSDKGRKFVSKAGAEVWLQELKRVNPKLNTSTLVFSIKPYGFT